MKTIIAGGRDITDYQILLAAVEASDLECNITEVVSGCARGVDELGERWSLKTGRGIATLFPAEWRTQGPAAGPIRNRKMAEYADALIAIWDGKSKGTKNMIETATKLGLTVYVHRI